MSDECKKKLNDQYQYVLGMLVYCTIQKLKGGWCAVSCDVRLKNLVEYYCEQSTNKLKYDFMDKSHKGVILNFSQYQPIPLNEIQLAYDQFVVPMRVVLQVYSLMRNEYGIPKEIIKIIDKLVLADRVKQIVFPQWIKSGVKCKATNVPKDSFDNAHFTMSKLYFYDDSCIEYARFVSYQGNDSFYAMIEKDIPVDNVDSVMRKKMDSHDFITYSI